MGVALFIIILLLAGILGSLIYAGKKVSSESTTVTNKVNSFNANVDSINKNLQGINSSLQTENTDLSQHLTLP
jgi:CHASE3 domain sensor protein